MTYTIYETTLGSVEPPDLCSILQQALSKGRTPVSGQSEPVNDIEYFVTLLRYVHQNPVKAGICVKAEEYTWSSWQEYLNDDGILPTLCYTKAVLKRITLDNLKELVDEILDGDITDVEYTTDDRLTDDDIRQYLRGHWQLEHPTDLQKKEKADRNEILIEAIQYGAPLRQLSD